jgi:hypothetical protein
LFIPSREKLEVDAMSSPRQVTAVPPDLADAMAEALDELVEAEASCDRQTVALCRREVLRLQVLINHRHDHQPHHTTQETS